nr:hypothetical protein MACL_00000735 [Theileria orientalis]
MKRPLIVFLFLFYGWKFATSEDESSVDCTLFKVRTEDTSEACQYKDNDTTKYKHELKGLLKNQPLYTFNTGVKFVALLYNDEFVWKHTSAHDSSKFPTELEIDPYNKTLWVKYGGMDFVTFKFENNKWKHSQDLSYGDCKRVTIPDYSDPSAASTPASPPAEVKAEEKVEEVEAEKAEDAKEEVAEVEVKTEEAAETEAKPAHEADESAKEKTDEAVEAEKTEEVGEKAELDAGEAEAGKDATEAGGARSLEGTSGESTKEEKGEHQLEFLERSKVTVHTLDNDGNSHEIDTTQYTVTEETGFLQVDFSDTAKLHKVDYDGVTVWTDSTYPCNGFPKRLYLNLKDNLLWVQSDDKMHTFQRFKNGWEVVESESECQVLKESAKEAATEVVADASPEASAEAPSVPAEGGESAGDVLLSNLYPSDHTGAHYCGLRGSELDEEVEVKEHESKEGETKEGESGSSTEEAAAVKAEEADASGSHLASEASTDADANEAKEGQAAKEGEEEGYRLPSNTSSEDSKSSSDDVLLGNLYPSEHTGAHYCGLRGSELDEEVEVKEHESKEGETKEGESGSSTEEAAAVKAEEADASGSHLASEASTDADANEAKEGQAAKEGEEGSTASADAGLASEDSKSSSDDVLLGNLYPSEHTGAHYCGLRGSELDEEVEVKEHESKEGETKEGESGSSTEEAAAVKAEEADASGSHLASEASTDADANEAKEGQAAKEGEEASEASTDADANEAKEGQAAKEGEEGSTASADAGLASEDSKSSSDDVLLGNLYPSEHTGAHYCGLRGSELDEEVEVKEHESKEGETKEGESGSSTEEATEASTDADTEKAEPAKEDADKAAAKKLEHNGKHLKVFTLADDEVSLEEDKEGKFDVVVEDNKLVVGKFNAGAKCVKLEYDGKEVWKHEEAKHGTKHPSEVRFNTDNLEVVVAFEEDKSKFTFKHDSKSNAHVLAHSFLPLDVSERPDKVKFYKDAAAAQEIGNADLSLSKESDGQKEFMVHRFNNGAKCHLVKYEGKDVWEYDEEYADNFPASVHYNTDDHELRVFVRHNWYYFYKFDTTKNEHDVYREKEPADYASKE